jgi:hypothetical protein
MKLNNKQFIISVVILFVIFIPATALMIVRNIFYILSDILEATADRMKNIDHALAKKYENFIRTVK